jgi:hypothetical protein
MHSLLESTSRLDSHLTAARCATLRGIPPAASAACCHIIRILLETWQCLCSHRLPHRSIRGFFFVQSSCSAFTASTLRPLSAYFNYTDESASGVCPSLSSLINALGNITIPTLPNGSTIYLGTNTTTDIWVTSPPTGYNFPSGGGTQPFVRARRPRPALA